MTENVKIQTTKRKHITPITQRQSLFMFPFSPFLIIKTHIHTKNIYIHFMMNLIIKALHRLSKFHSFQHVFEGLVTFNCNFKLVENCKNRTKNSHIPLMKNHQLLNILSYINIFNGYKIFPRFNNLYNIPILNT